MTGTIVRITFAFTALISCDRGDRSDGDNPNLQETPSLTQGQSRGSTAGISWTVPERWTPGRERQMRVATYVIPATGETDAGECAVFYFGQGEGGDVESNMARWIGQMEPEGEPTRSTREIDGINVHLIDISGTYLASMGPMVSSGEPKEGYRLLGAIAEAPQGSVFFKTTGPAETIGSAEPEFNGLVGSIIQQ